jgi:hypothetical protein
MVCQMNFKAFGGLSDTLDDFFGAINKATMKVAVVGEASYSYEKKCDVFKVERLGFYIRDTYDFNEDGEGLKAWLNDLAGLGVWSKDRTLSKADTAIYRVNYDAVKNKIGTIPMRVAAALLLAARYPGFVPVDNGDFRKYQDKINKGGDYFVFSDVYWVRSNVAEFIIPA